MTQSTKWPSRSSVVGIISLGTGRLFFATRGNGGTPSAGTLDGGEIILAIQQAYAMTDHTITKMKRNLAIVINLNGQLGRWQMYRRSHFDCCDV